MRKFPQKSIDAAVTGLSNARAVLDGVIPAPPNPWENFEGVVHLRKEHVVEEPPLQEPPPEDDWNHTRRDLG